MWYNRVVQWLLGSPFHKLISQRVLLLSYTGRVSHRPYATPVNYVWLGDAFSVVSYRTRHWWRNLRGGQPVSLLWQGRTVRGVGEVIEDTAGVEAALLAHLSQVPQDAKFFGVRRDAAGHLDAADVARVAQDKVMIRIRPT